MRFNRMIAAAALGLAVTCPPLHAEMTPIKGPATGDLGTIAQIKIPQGDVFLAQKDVKEFMDKTHNLYSDNQLGLLSDPDKTSGYLVLFSFDDVGYIKDAANEKLDADQLWKEMVSNQAEENKTRKEKGWTEWELVDWVLKPNYNPQTQRLEWAIRIKDNGKEFVNYSTRILGRRGVMTATLVPNGDLQNVLTGFNQTIAGFDYKQGNRYAEWTTGDKVADFGLAALVVGGAGALAAKTGLLGKLWGVIALVLAKGAKLVIVAFAAMAAFFRKLFGGGKKGGNPPSGLVK